MESINPHRPSLLTQQPMPLTTGRPSDGEGVSLRAMERPAVNLNPRPTQMPLRAEELPPVRTAPPLVLETEPQTGQVSEQTSKPSPGWRVFEFVARCLVVGNFLSMLVNLFKGNFNYALGDALGLIPLVSVIVAFGAALRDVPLPLPGHI